MVIAAHKSTVYVVGAINVDAVIQTPRLPGPGETVVGGGVEHYGGGKGANAAVAAARVGAEVVLIGAVGDDKNGAFALADLSYSGVNTYQVTRCRDRSTGLALIVVDAAGENQIAVGAGANTRVTAESVSRTLRHALRPSDCVLVSTEIPGDAVLAAVRSASEIGARCVLNPAPPIDEVIDALASQPILTPNAGECRELVARIGISVANTRSAAEALCHYTKAPVIVTMGSEGLIVCEPGLDPLHIGALEVDVVDTTGAGDTFNGVFTARLAAGEAIDVAATVANRAAALAVGTVGARAGMPRAADLSVSPELNPKHTMESIPPGQGAEG